MGFVKIVANFLYLSQAIVKKIHSTELPLDGFFRAPIQKQTCWITVLDRLTMNTVNNYKTSDPYISALHNHCRILHAFSRFAFKRSYLWPLSEIASTGDRVLIVTGRFGQRSHQIDTNTMPHSFLCFNRVAGKAFLISLKYAGKHRNAWQFHRSPPTIEPNSTEM